MNSELPDTLQKQLQAAWQRATAEIIGSAPEMPSFSIAIPRQVLDKVRKEFGSLPAEGVLMRLGRAFARYLLPTLSTSPQFKTSAFRLMPRKRKVQRVTQSLTQILNSAFGAQMLLRQETHLIEWVLPNQQSAASFWAGFLQETVYWASGGKFLPVTLTQDANSVAISIAL